MAASTEADRIINTLRIELPGATDAAIYLALFNTIDEFLRGSNAWRVEAQVNLVFGVLQYPIFPPGGTSLIRVIGAQHRGMPVAQVAATPSTAVLQLGQFSPDELNVTGSEFLPDEQVGVGSAFEYSIFYPDFLTLTVAPSEDATLDPFKILMSISMAADNLEDEPGDWPIEGWMWERFHEAWVDGVTGRMMGQKAKPYSDMALAAYHLKRFRAAMGQAMHEANEGFISKPRSWRFPKFGR